MKRLLFSVSLLVLASCGGGGNGGGNPPVQMPPTTNSPPQITSTGTATVTENNQAVLTVGATDADGNSLTFSISGGADANDFQISNTGALRFASDPNFELPTDENQDNVYDLTVSVSDGTATTSQNITVTVENDREGISVRRIATGMNDITAIAAIPGSNDVFVAERAGRISRINPSSGSVTLDRTLENVNTDREGGLLGLAVNPDFQSSNSYTVLATIANNRDPISGAMIPTSDLQLRSINRSRPEPQGRGILINHPQETNYGGGLLYLDDGTLFVGIGDADAQDNAQDSNTKLGKILRVILNPDPFAGASPGPAFIGIAGNPFFNGGGDRTIFSMGVQNVTQMSRFGDSLFFGDNGLGAIEEINILSLNGVALNFGWPFFEGSQPNIGTTTASLTAPVTEYVTGLGQREGGDVTGGYVYSGSISSLNGRYVFAENRDGNIWSVDASNLNTTSLFPANQYEVMNADFAPDIGTIDRVVAFGIDSQNNLYFADSDGEIFIVEPA